MDEIRYRIKALDPDAMFDEQFDGQVQAARRTGLAQGPARRAPPVGRAAHRDLYADIYQALPPPNAARG